jgi:hypothetical protein
VYEFRSPPHERRFRAIDFVFANKQELTGKTEERGAASALDQRRA